MKFHTATGSPAGRKVEAVIEHLGLSVAIEHHAPAEFRTSGYLALNPNGMVPVLEDGALTLWESNAIMQYLADKAGDDALFPRAPRQRADVVRWQFWELVHFNRAFGALAFELTARTTLGRGPADQGIVAVALADLARFAPVLEGHLAGRRTLVGETVTIADYSMLTFESYRGKTPFDWSPFANINRYFDELGALDAWRRPKERHAAQAARAA